jgi:hypothetical protein
MRFEPNQLTGDASLNRLRVLVDGHKIPPEIAGKTGLELCSARALAAMIRARAQALALQAHIGAQDHELILRFNDCFAATTSHVRDAAQDVARNLARNMAFIVLAAKHKISTQNLDEWQRGYWGHWQSISTVVFGGGIVAGNLGRTFSNAVQQQWDNQRLPPLRFLVDPRPGQITLDGLISTLHGREGKFLALDFGGTFVKQAVAVCHPAATPIIHELPKIPVPREIASPTDDQPGGKLVFEFLAQTITAACHQHTPSPALIPISLATYVIDGHLQPQGGGYYAMRHIAENVQTALSHEVGQRIGKEATIRLMHDGTAAAMKYAGYPNLAVIMMGTALGIGLAPETPQPTQNNRGRFAQ